MKNLHIYQIKANMICLTNNTFCQNTSLCCQLSYFDIFSMNIIPNLKAMHFLKNRSIRSEREFRKNFKWFEFITDGNSWIDRRYREERGTGPRPEGRIPSSAPQGVGCRECRGPGGWTRVSEGVLISLHNRGTGMWSKIYNKMCTKRKNI